MTEDISLFDLVGSGGYDRLSATLTEGSSDTDIYPLEGVIYPGDLPPDR